MYVRTKKYELLKLPLKQQLKGAFTVAVIYTINIYMC